MRAVLAICVALFGLVFAGNAFAGSMDARFGNTVVAKTPDGAETRFYYNKDGTLTVTVEMGGKVVVQATGTWRQDGKNICLKLSPPFGPFTADKETCVPLTGDKVGDTWTVPSKDASGHDTTATVTIVKGR
jgi:YD repeat-containing protein